MAAQDDKIKTLHLLDEPENPDETYTKQKANFTDAYAQEKAEKLGCDILLSDGRTLQLDIDNDVAFEKFQQQLELFKELKMLVVESCDVLPSKSGNKHVILKVSLPNLRAGLTIKERIMYQALLGSDVKREMLALAGYYAGQENPILLFRPRESNAGRS